jgi:hypothetical protein
LHAFTWDNQETLKGLKTSIKPYSAPFQRLR